MTIVFHKMDEKYSKKTRIWEEIYINSPSETPSRGNTGSFTILESRINADSYPPESQMDNLKEGFKTLLSQSLIEMGFQPELFLSSDLLGNIRLKAGSFSDTIYPRYANSLESEKEILALLEDILGFYSGSFLNDSELLEWITPILLQLNRITDLIQFLNQFHRRNVLPLKFQLFFILVGIYENNLQNIILNGEDTNLINILYKYKFLNLSKLEKNRLYDMVISRENMDLIGIIFHLFGDVHQGIRNIHPIYEIIKKNFDQLDNSERKEFLESFKETGRYIEIYFLMKRAYNKKEIKNYIIKMKMVNGKSEPSPEKTFPGYNEKEDILQKYNKLKESQKAHTLSPFEIILLLNTNISIKLKQEIQSTYQRIPYSYIANRAIAVLSYFESDYRNFLIYLEKTGSLKHHAECVYLRALSLAELGESKEARKLLNRLKALFPDTQVIREAIENLKS